MQKLEEMDEIIFALKQGDMLTCDGKDRFVYKKQRVYCYNQGTRFGMDLDEFKELYRKQVFYVYEEQIEIDEEKDEAYYRYYPK